MVIAPRRSETGKTPRKRDHIWPAKRPRHRRAGRLNSCCRRLLQKFCQLSGRRPPDREDVRTYLTNVYKRPILEGLRAGGEMSALHIRATLAVPESREPVKKRGQTPSKRHNSLTIPGGLTPFFHRLRVLPSSTAIPSILLSDLARLETLT